MGVVSSVSIAIKGVNLSRGVPCQCEYITENDLRKWVVENEAVAVSRFSFFCVLLSLRCCYMSSTYYWYVVATV
jgi:hypothetical protein